MSDAIQSLPLSTKQGMKPEEFARVEPLLKDVAPKKGVCPRVSWKVIALTVLLFLAVNIPFISALIPFSYIVRTVVFAVLFIAITRMF